VQERGGDLALHALPEGQVAHRLAQQVGQVFLPGVNLALMVATIAIAVGFERSSNLAGAYGVAVSTTMVITTLLVAWVAIEQWGWRPWLVLGGSVAFLVIDLAFFGANLVKIPTGGWLPLVMAGALFVAMSTWKRGSEIVSRQIRGEGRPLEEYLEELAQDPPQRVEGTAVVLTEDPVTTPTVLLHQLEFNRVLHEHVVVITLLAEPFPYLPADVEVEDLSLGFRRVVARHGFMQTPRIDRVLERCCDAGLDLAPYDVTFLVSRETAVPDEEVGMPRWRARIFSFMQRNAIRSSDFLALPHARVMEIGVEVEL